MCSRVSARARSESTAWPQSCFWQRSRISSAPVPVIDRKQFSRVDELFDAALDKPPEERASFLGEACARDAALREEVQKLLELSAKEDSLFPSGAMKGPIWEEVARELQGGDDATIVPGDHIGPYEILDLLGRGGMEQPGNGCLSSSPVKKSRFCSRRKFGGQVQGRCDSAERPS